MLKTISSLFKNTGKSTQKAFAQRISSFNDPLAGEIEWVSITRPRIGYLNRKPLKTRNGSILFVPSVIAVLFFMPFIILGGFLMWNFSLLQPPIEAIVLHPISTIRHYVHLLPRLLSSDKVWGHLFSLGFLLMGLQHLFYSVRPIVFNAAKRLYSKGFWSKNKASFDDIHAIQVITDSGNGPDSPTIFELNLVLKNGKRVHVFGHPKGKL